MHIIGWAMDGFGPFSVPKVTSMSSIISHSIRIFNLDLHICCSHFPNLQLFIPTIIYITKYCAIVYSRLQQ